MVTLDKIRLDMAELQKLDQSVRSVEVHADTLDEALADAAVQLNTKVSNLEYEVKEKGFDGFFGIAKRPWFITVYQNAESVAKSAKFKELQKSGLMDMDEEIENIDRDGEFFLHHFGTDICLKVNLPVGEGKPVNLADILNDIKRPDTVDFDENLIKKFAAKGTGGVYETVGHYSRNPAADAIFVVDISKDELKATCTINPPALGGADVSHSQIETALKGQGVVAGISDEKIEALVDRPSYNVPVVVAEAVLPVDGRDAYIAYNFETDRSKMRAKEAANGQVDFKELNLIQNVVEGQPLAQKMLPERGKSGKTLFGRYLEAKNGKDINLPLGKNVTLDSDGRTILAACNGQVLLINDKINVEPIMEIDGVNIKSGNITFLGTVIVNGNVEDGYNVKASGNIEVNGEVGASTLESDGDIIVSHGIVGRDECKILCGGSLWAKFIQNSRVEVEENVIVQDSIMNCEVSAQHRIILQGKRAQITGGHLFATETVLAKNIGSAGGGTETVIEVGIDPRAKHRLEDLREMQEKALKELDELELNIQTLENTKKVRRVLPAEKEESLKRFNLRKNELSRENDEFNKEIEEILAHLRELKNIGKVYVSGTVYAGVKIFVRDEKDEVRANVKSVTFYYDEGFVRRGKYEKPDFEDVKGPEGYSNS
ncbi:FapA family protein [uncultured Treponema sp.]|uniref:FapA family protein n=1 Tax=uncultured Treponema sp. TaxID=162155 RepID=UPI0015C0CE60|nr:FapA family protein [uncultured Treponema sp.]